jgi:A118 family predicted phage portal protein
MNANEIIEKVTGSKLYDISDYIANWLDWYTGKVKNFHSYTIYNGKKQVQMERMSLGMPKRACEDWANLLLNEKTDITVADARSQEILHRTLADCKFWQKGNEGIEKSFALGMGAFVTVVDGIGVNEDGTLADTSKTKVKVKFVNATKIKPITFEDEEITECAFINVNSKKTYISIHLKNEQGNYEIHNITCEGDADNLSIARVGEAEAHEVFDTQSPLPWFQIIKPNIANNIDINSPLGISIFANAIDNAKETDLVWDSYANEFILGRKRIFVNAKEWYISRNGEEQDVFDSNDVVIYHLPEADDGKQMISDQTQTLRVADHISALQNQLNLFGYKCGLGTEHYKFDGAGVATATQIVSVNSEMFRNIKKHEIILEEVLVGMVKSVLYAIDTFTSETVKVDAEITIKFDDSIIVDEASERTQDLVDVNSGIMSKVEYRMKWYNEDEKTAQDAIENIDSFSITDTENMPFGEEEQPAEV